MFCNPMEAACQASLSFTISPGLLKLKSSELVMPSNHLILCHPPLILPSILPSIRVFSNKSALHIRWPRYWSLSFSISPSNEYSGLISFRIDCFSSLKLQGSSATPQFKNISFSTLSLLYGPSLKSIHDYWKTYRSFSRGIFLTQGLNPGLLHFRLVFSN